MNIDDLSSLLDGFDPASLLPELDSVLGGLVSAMGVAVMVAPVALLVMGIAYILFAPKEANYIFGYRCYFGMGSVEAWRYAQRMAGLIWTLLGLVLTVAMAVVTRGFAAKEAVDVLPEVLKCVLWEAGLTVLSCIIINALVMRSFTADGERRR